MRPLLCNLRRHFRQIFGRLVGGPVYFSIPCIGKDSPMFLMHFQGPGGLPQAPYGNYGPVGPLPLFRHLQ